MTRSGDPSALRTRRAINHALRTKPEDGGNHSYRTRFCGMVDSIFRQIAGQHQPVPNDKFEIGDDFVGRYEQLFGDIAIKAYQHTESFRRRRFGRTSETTVARTIGQQTTQKLAGLQMQFCDPIYIDGIANPLRAGLRCGVLESVEIMTKIDNSPSPTDYLGEFNEQGGAVGLFDASFETTLGFADPVSALRKCTGEAGRRALLVTIDAFDRAAVEVSRTIGVPNPVQQT